MSIDDAEWRDKQMLYEQQQQSEALKSMATNISCLVFVVILVVTVLFICTVLWGISFL